MARAPSFPHARHVHLFGDVAHNKTLHIGAAPEFRELETQYNAKINTEVARYQALLSEREDQNRKWDEDNQALVDTQFADSDIDSPTPQKQPSR